MAFSKRLGSLMSQSLTQNNVSMFNAVRCMSSKLSFLHLSFGSTYIFLYASLSFSTDDDSLKEAFSSFGEVTEARVITDRDSGRSRGFGFVNYANDDSAKEALSAMDGQELNGRNIRVSVATERAPRGGGGGGGFGGGGYGGGGYGGSERY